MADSDDQSKADATTTAEQTEEQQESLLDQIAADMRLRPTDHGYAEARRGVEHLIANVLTREGRGAQRVDSSLVDTMLAELDRRIGAQVDEILHLPELQKLESAWRSLKFLVDRVDFRENMQIDLLQATKEELAEDFEDSPGVVSSGLYRHIYTAEYGQFGGKPFGAIIGNFEFGPGNADLALLSDLASVASMAHAPLITAASPTFFGSEEQDFQQLPFWRDLESHFNTPQYIKWKSFRESDDARNVGLTLPRFMLRAPYKAEEAQVKSFVYDEHASAHQDFLWGNAAFALASRIADSFAKYRWCPNIIGPASGGAVEDLPIHTYEAMGQIEVKVPTEVLISERREFELSEAGFIALTMRKDSDNACFFSANSAQKPKYFGTSPEAKEAETNFRLGTQLPYMFIISRLAHYIKVLQRENIGSWKTRPELQQELTSWINQYVVDMDDPDPITRSRKPLRQVNINVEDLPGNPGWYKVGIKVVPHMKFMGAFFTLSLVGKLDKE